VSTINTSPKETLDLRQKSILTKEQAVLLDQIAGEIRPAYTEFVSEFFKGSSHSIQWQLTPLMCRNTNDCNLFKSLCKLELVKQYCSTGKSGTIILDSPFVYQTVKNICHPKIKIVNTKGWFSRVFSIIAKNTKPFVVMMVTFSSRFIASRVIGRRTLPAEQSKITIVDTVFYNTSFREKEFYDRHFPGMLEGLSGDEIDSIFYIGYYYRINNLFDYFKKIKSSTSNILIIEEFLKFRDYLYAISSFRFLFKNFKFVKFRGCDITSLFQECYYENIVNIGTSEGLLKYRFISRLKQRGVELRSVLMWFENQPNNRGMQIGLNEFYPDTPTNGYIGFFNSNNVVGVYPSAEELTSGVLPHNISVIGKKIVPEIKIFCPELNVMISPALRFQSLLNLGQVLEPPKFVLLVVLPIFKQESYTILESLYSVVRRDSNVAVKIKIHPGSNIKSIEKFVSGFGFARCITEVPVYDAILESSVVMTSASSSAVEAVLLGRPTLLLSDCRGPTKNPIPPGIPKDLYAVCYDYRDIESNLRLYMDSSVGTVVLRREAASQCRNNYIEIYTPDASRELLGLDVF
tara:strand:- start:1810 stop:3531 length:1722 start_codon:yes stop_codon:yes gene_type:complete